MIVPTNNIIAYIIRVEVEFRHEGHAEQHNEQAALPQQQASWNYKKKLRKSKNKYIRRTCAAEQRPKTAPILSQVDFSNLRQFENNN